MSMLTPPILPPSSFQDLENSIRNHNEERLEKIQELGDELCDHECMVATIVADLKTIMDRWNLLHNQVSRMVFHVQTNYGFLFFIFVISFLRFVSPESIYGVLPLYLYIHFKFYFVMFCYETGIFLHQIHSLKKYLLIDLYIHIETTISLYQ